MFAGPYLAGGVGIVMLVIGGWGLLERTWRVEAEKDVVAAAAEKAKLEEEKSRLIDTVDSLNRNVDRMLRQAEQDNRILTAVTSERNRLLTVLEDTRAELRTLEANDEAAAQYLGTRIPDGVRPFVNRRTNRH